MKAYMSFNRPTTLGELSDLLRIPTFRPANGTLDREEQMAINEIADILAETEDSSSYCVRTIPGDIRGGWWSHDERFALAEALAQFLALDLQS